MTEVTWRGIDLRKLIHAGALPTLHERYGLTVDRIVAKVLAELG